MRKGVAVPYIIALILGIVVIGLLGYWFFVLGGQAGGTATSQGCNTKIASWCQQWSVTGFSGTCPSTQAILVGESCDLKDPNAYSNANDAWKSFAPGCGNQAPSAPTCQALYGQTTSAPPTSGTTTGSGGSTCTPPCGQGYSCVNGQCVK